MSVELCGIKLDNPVIPASGTFVKETAKMYDDDFRNCVLLAERLGVDTINTFSGCPGDSPEAKHPNWPTCAWPDEFLEVLDYQWNEVLIPYWKEASAFAREHGVTKIALEMHPGFCVYNVETLLKLRRAVGPEIGANFDRPTSSGRASTRSPRSARSARRARYSTSTPRTPRSTSTTPRSTACSIPSTTATSSTGAGSSARSATATI